MLTKDEILYLMERLSQVAVVKPTPQFPFTISKRQSGYSEDPMVSQLQGKLSIMLEAANRRSA